MSIYIHIPFCSSICSYCDFCKVYYNKKYIEKYLNSLEAEIKERYNNELVNTIYIGGGTPTSLDEYELIRLFDIIKLFNISDSVEFTIEGNIESITENKLKIMKKYGINRISIGVESFNKDVIKLLGRKHTKEDVFNKIELTKKYFDNINIDLIYAAYNDINVLKEDINCFLELDISHVSLYSLIIEDNTKLKIDGFENINEDLDFEMYNYIEHILEENDYIHYEISNYAKKGYESKHNMVYWNNDYYYGFGLSSTSFINNERRVNTKNLTKYLRGDYFDISNVESEEERMENEVMLGLRKISGVNVNVFKKKYNKSIDDVFKNIIYLIENGYLIKDDDYIKINKKYIYVSNEILVRLFD